jgi:hypothetical protein
MKSTVICHFFNEEYLLPFWLAHHTKIFDHGVIVDYRSTDKSLDIVRKICPLWSIMTSRNKNFEAAEVDKEVMEIEQSLNGIKMVLNVTEFIFPTRPLKTYFKTEEPQCFSLEATTPVSLFMRDEDPMNLTDLLKGIETALWADGERMGHRLIHNYTSGLYEVGRHESGLSSTNMPDAILIWLGFFPWTDRLIQRKLQIMAQIPESDVQKHYGIMQQHTMTAAELERKRMKIQSNHKIEHRCMSSPTLSCM